MAWVALNLGIQLAHSLLFAFQQLHKPTIAIQENTREVVLRIVGPRLQQHSL